MYQIVSGISFLIRAYLCYLTIDNIPIFENHLMNNLFFEAFSFYTLLLIISRITVSFFYVKGVDSPYKGCGLYFVIYIAYMLILFFIISLLTFFRVLPL